MEKDIQKVVDARPNVFGHNIETVKRLQKSVRDMRANYGQSLAVLDYVKKSAPKIYTKSSIMVGLGETSEEVLEAMRDLRKVNVDFLTIGQYLRPKEWNLPVVEYVKPEQFEWYRCEGEKMGFKYVASGPFVRSSYNAGKFFKNMLQILDHEGNVVQPDLLPPWSDEKFLEIYRQFVLLRMADQKTGKSAETRKIRYLRPNRRTKKRAK